MSHIRVGTRRSASVVGVDSMIFKAVLVEIGRGSIPHLIVDFIESGVGEAGEQRAELVAAFQIQQEILSLSQENVFSRVAGGD
jgi:hypothetical protein